MISSSSRWLSDVISFECRVHLVLSPAESKRRWWIQVQGCKSNYPRPTIDQVPTYQDWRLNDKGSFRWREEEDLHSYGNNHESISAYSWRTHIRLRQLYLQYSALDSTEDGRKRKNNYTYPPSTQLYPLWHARPPDYSAQRTHHLSGKGRRCWLVLEKH